MMLGIFDKIMYKINRIIFGNENTSSLEFEIGIEEKKISYSKGDAKEKVNKAFNYIMESKLRFEDLEIVFYGMMNMIYLYSTDMEINILEKLYIDMESYINKTNLGIKKKKYLIMLQKIVYLNSCYANDIISNISEVDYGQCKIYEDKKYKNKITELVGNAQAIFPNGKIIRLLNEIYMLEDFFRNPNDDNLNIIQRSCFNKKDSWIKHILLCEGNRRYLPYIELITDVSNNYDIKDSMISMFKHEYPAGSWGGNSEDNWNEKEEFWKDNVYDQIFMQPYKIYTETSEGGLIYTLLQLLSDNKILEETKNNIVSDFVHSYGNYEIDNVYEIAKALSKRPSQEELENCSRMLLMEYLNKQMMSKEVRMLSLEHKENFEELKEDIRSSIDKENKGIFAIDIVEEALKRVVLRILLEVDNKRIEDIVAKYEKRNIDIFELLDNFEKDVIKQDENCIRWVQDNMNKLYVGIVKEWKGICFKGNSDGQAFLMSLFMELIYNMFTYADINYDMNFFLKYEKGVKYNYFVVKTENVVDKNISSNTKRGLDSKNRILSKINYGKDYLWKNSVIKTYRGNNTICSVKARIKDSVFVGKK
jgi:hypothetical protein